MEAETSRAETEQVQQNQKELRLIGRMNRVPGHTLFSFNRDTGEIKPADFERKVTLNFAGVPVFEEKVVVGPSCYYEQALNRKNFVKRLRRKGIYVRE
jgi:hypothetical protein